MSSLGQIVALLLFVAVPPAGFLPIVERSAVAVFRRPGVPGVELYAEGDIAAPPSRVQAVLLDYEHAVGNIHDVAESRVIRRSDGMLWVYQRLDLPILADRDYTLAVSFGGLANSFWVRFSCANSEGPLPIKGVVRIALHEGSWELEPSIDGQKTHARYRVHMDLAGSLPGWMARSGAAKEIPALFEGLRQRLR